MYSPFENSKTRIAIPDNQAKNHNIGKTGSEVYNFSRGFNPLPYTEVNTNPGKNQTSNQFPLGWTRIFDTFWQTQNPITGKQTQKYKYYSWLQYIIIEDQEISKANFFRSSKKRTIFFSKFWPRLPYPTGTELLTHIENYLLMF